MQLDARDMRLIEAVAEEGSLTRAGARLNATQPALSRHLQSLERRTRLALFERTGRRMVLTTAGERLRVRARDVLNALDTAEAELRTLRGDMPATLRLSTACYTSYHWLPRVLRRLAVRHPAVQVRIEFALTRQPVQALLDGRLDIALVTGVRSGRRLVVRQVFTDEHVLVVAPTHPWAGRASVSPREIAGERLLIIPPPEDSDVVTGFLRPAGAADGEIHAVSLTESLVAMVEAGFGVGAVPRWTVGPQIQSGRLAALRLGRGLRRHWGVATRRSAPASEMREDFIALLSQIDPADGSI